MPTSRSARNVVGAVLLVSLIVVWWWPGLSGQDGQVDVHVVASASMNPSRDVIERRIREEGRVVVWQDAGGEECSVSPAANAQWEVLVIGLPAGRGCAPGVVRGGLDVVRERFPHRPIVVVLDWSINGDQNAESLLEAGFHVVDPRSLIGRPGEEQPCLWWDDCPSDGFVTTVEDGRLTEAGSQRLARSIVTGILE